MNVAVDARAHLDEELFGKDAINWSVRSMPTWIQNSQVRSGQPMAAVKMRASAASVATTEGGTGSSDLASISW